MRPVGDEPTTVLYVEDSPTNQALMTDLIRRRPGVRLVIAGTGQEAIEHAAAERPDLILLDRHLPDMTGIDVLRAIRARPETAQVPVVVVSGDTSTSSSDEAALGVIGSLSKPFDVFDVFAYIDSVHAADQ